MGPDVENFNTKPELVVQDEGEPKKVVFHKQQDIVHVVSGKKYFIVLLPDNFKIEKTNEPAFLYSDGKEFWARPAHEMTDGRFLPKEVYDTLTAAEPK